MIDKQEFEQIFRRHYDGMFRLARRMLGSDEESKDVVSDVFAQLPNSHADLRSDTLQGFLLTSENRNSSMPSTTTSTQSYPHSRSRFSACATSRE